jgi:Cu-Zn family superoxide dismutase
MMTATRFPAPPRRRSRLLLSFLLLPLAAGCARTGIDSAPPPAAAAAELRDAGGRIVATARLLDERDGLRVQVTVTGLNAGSYGAHIHAVGRCDPPGFESAGPHWNPAGRQHGSRNPMGQHAGDLPNLFAGADGRGTLEYLVRGARLAGGGRMALLDGDGSALVIHAAADDHRTDPSGNSGARIACGVFAPAG